MKHGYLYFLPLFAAVGATAQYIHITNGNVGFHHAVEAEAEIPFNPDHSVTIGGKTFPLSEFHTMSVEDDCPVSANAVVVSYSGNEASVHIDGNIAQYVHAEVNGAHVSIIQSAEVSEATCGEITYVLSGASADGSLLLSGEYKCTLELQGVDLLNPSGAALEIQNGKRVAISAKSGTTNTLEDGATGSQKGAVACKGHLEFKGKGVLNIKGNKSHAIQAKEYVEVKNLTLNITGAVKDGINCGQYFSMSSGNVSITDTGDDGIQVSYKDDVDREPEDTGCFSISGGSLGIHIAKGEACKGIKADADVNISEGNIYILSECNGIWDSVKLKTKASACIGADGNVNIDGGIINLKASGSGGKGISCDGVFTANGGDCNVQTIGGLLVYSNGTLNHNYTSNAERVASDYKSSAKGIKADSGLIINGGTFYVTTSTNNAEGLESKKDLEINGGTVFVKAYDDGINASNDFRVSGGDLTVISVVSDGLDSNGNLYISGGKIITMGSGGMEMGLDAATESGCAVYITGGTVFSFGGNNTYPTKAGSTQAFVTATGAVKAGSVVSVSGNDEVLAGIEIPEDYNSTPITFDVEVSKGLFRGPGNGFGPGGWNPGGTSGSGSIMISCPQLVSGQSYSVSNGTTQSTSTAVLTKSGR